MELAIRLNSFGDLWYIVCCNGYRVKTSDVFKTLEYMLKPPDPVPAVDIPIEESSYKKEENESNRI